MNRDWYVNVVSGACLWVILFIASLLELMDLGWIEQLLLLAPLVIVPLGLSFIPYPGRWIIQTPLRLFQQMSACLVALSFVVTDPVAAGVMVIPWALFTIFLALMGLGRFLSRKGLDITELCFDAALIYLSVGGFHLCLSRFGITVMGFSDITILLTAVHFHYAGFAAPILAGLTGRSLDRDWIDKVCHHLAAMGILAGPLLLACGIVFWPALEFAAALVLAVSVVLIAMLMITVLPRLERGLAKMLFAMSACSVGLAMVLAGFYAWGEFLRDSFISIPTMARIHGTLNAVGFALCGLIANALLNHSVEQKWR